MATHPCAPGIWKKLNAHQRKLWMAFYETFLFEHNFHADWDGRKYREQRKVTAHNLACQALWLVAEEYEIYKVYVDKTNTLVLSKKR